MASITRKQIEEFLGHKRLAVVGVSRQPKSFSRRMYHDLQDRGYDVVAVSPHLEDIEGHPCFPRLQDIPQPVEGALLFTNPEVTAQVVHDCAEAGIPRVWMHHGGGRGAESEEGIAFCEEHGIDVIWGQCPYMFLPRAGFAHRVHGFFKKLGGSYPAEA